MTPLLLLLLGADASLAFRAAAGAEWDTNALRAVESSVAVLEGASLPGTVRGDAVLRLLFDARAEAALDEDHGLSLGYVLGTKRFRESRSEDLLVHDLTATTRHRLWPSLEVGLLGSLRASRIRSGTRDYTLGVAGAHGTLRFLDQLALRLQPSFAAFGFHAEPRLSYQGPAFSAELSYTPEARLVFSALAGHAWRSYRQALVRAVVPNGFGGTTTVVTFCDGKDDPIVPPACTPAERDDRELSLGLRVSYGGRVLVGGEYLLRVQRSSSDLEDFDRHRLSAHLTLPLPLEITASLMAALQVSSGVSVTSTKYLAEDDENQNSVQAQLQRRLVEELSLELRWALFANQFNTADARFLRQTVYLGVSYRLGSGA